MDLNLSGKTALVCGSTQGIGKASALELALLGARVVLISRNEDALKAAVNDLSGNQKQEHTYLIADFNDPENVSSTVKKFISDGNVIHVLVNNTGGPAGGAITKAEVSSFEAAFRQHLLCNHLLVQAVLEGMVATGYGRVINIISTSVKAPLKNLGVSNTIRAAVANWAKTLANEVAGSGITVNNVLPGATLTSRLHSIIENKSRSTGKNTAELEAEMIHEIPAGRFADPAEVAAAVAFLASPAAAYINGINLPVDGGRTPNL